MNTMAELLAVPRGSALARLEEGTRLQQFEVDAARSSASGDGLSPGPARNVIQVSCMDTDVLLADWATLEGPDYRRWPARPSRNPAPSKSPTCWSKVGRTKWRLV